MSDSNNKESTDRILEVNSIAKTFHTGFFRTKVHAIRDVSFSIDKGEIFGLIGPNGAGKSTTIKAILGLLSPDKGSINLFGEPVANNVGIRDRIGYLPEKSALYEHLKVRELLQFYGSMFGMSRSTCRERIDDLVELVGLSDATDRPIDGFSKGMKQRAGIAQALINDPELVILDEPQSGLDPIGRREIRDLILDLRRRGKTILFCSHILPDVQDICDRVAVLKDGVVQDVGYLYELISSETLYHEAYVRNWSEAAESTLSDIVQESVKVGGMTRLRLSGTSEAHDLLDRLAAADVRVESFEAHKESLEDVFVRDTAD